MSVLIIAFQASILTCNICNNKFNKQKALVDHRCHQHALLYVFYLCMPSPFSSPHCTHLTLVAAEGYVLGRKDVQSICYLCQKPCGKTTTQVKQHYQINHNSSHWGQTPIYPVGTLRTNWEQLSNLFTKYPGGKFWTYSQFAHHFDCTLITGQILNLISKNPSIYPVGILLQNPGVSFIICPQHVWATHQKFFQICSEICSHCAQPLTQWVNWEFVGKLTKLRFNWEYIRRNSVDICLRKLKTIYERTFDEWLKHVVDKLGKKPQGVLKEYPQDKLMGSLRSNSKFAQWSKCDQSGGQIENKFKTCFLNIWWTNYLIVFNLFSMYIHWVNGGLLPVSEQ